jgi:hypothetical protein
VDGPSDLNRTNSPGRDLGLHTNVCGHPYSLQIASRSVTDQDAAEDLATARLDLPERGSEFAVI